MLLLASINDVRSLPRPKTARDGSLGPHEHDLEFELPETCSNTSTSLTARSVCFPPTMPLTPLRLMLTECQSLVAQDESEMEEEARAEAEA